MCSQRRPGSTAVVGDLRPKTTSSFHSAHEHKKATEQPLQGSRMVFPDPTGCYGEKKISIMNGLHLSISKQMHAETNLFLEKMCFLT